MTSQPESPRWTMQEPRRRWHYISADGTILGYVARNFGLWDGYIITGNKFPNHQRGTNFHGRDRRIWEAKRTVEAAIRGGVNEK